MFLRKGVLKICSIFTEQHPCRSVFSIKLLCKFIEIVLRHGCSPVNFLHIFRTIFPKNTSAWLLLIWLTNSDRTKFSWTGNSGKATGKQAPKIISRMFVLTYDISLVVLEFKTSALKVVTSGRLYSATELSLKHITHMIIEHFLHARRDTERSIKDLKHVISEAAIRGVVWGLQLY